MTSIERTAYPQFKRLTSARVLHVFFTPSEDEVAWARERTETPESLLALLVDLKCFQRMARFCSREEIPHAVTDHVRHCPGLAPEVEPDHGAERTMRLLRAHVLICMLACYLTWHLRQAWAPLTFTDQDPPAPENPVAPARRSAAAQAKASYQHDPAGQPYHSFRGLLEHLATLTRNQVRYAGTQVSIPMLTEPTSTQRQAFHLLGIPIPLTLK